MCQLIYTDEIAGFVPESKASTLRRAATVGIGPAGWEKSMATASLLTASGLPVMLRTNANAGRGVSTNKFAQLGMK